MNETVLRASVLSESLVSVTKQGQVSTVFATWLMIKGLLGQEILLQPYKVQKNANVLRNRLADEIST